MLAVGLDGRGERIKTLVTRVEARLDRMGHVAVRIDDQTNHEPALRIEAGRNKS